MNLRDLKYLVALADHGHFGKAAEACCVSQPALSIQIKKLEEVLGVVLVERINKTFLLTPIGKTIAERARALLQQANEIKILAKQAQDPFSGELKLGFISTVGPYLLPYIMPNLSKSFPRLMFYLVEEKTQYLLDEVRCGELDAAIVSLNISEADLTSQMLYEEEFKLAVSNKNELSKKLIIKPTDLKNQAVLLLEEGHCLRTAALEFCDKIKTAERKSFQATSLETLHHMVMVNTGVTLMPSLACKNNPAIRYIPLHSQPKRIIGMAWRNSDTKTVLLASVLECIKKSISKEKLIQVL